MPFRWIKPRSSVNGLRTIERRGSSLSSPKGAYREKRGHAAADFVTQSGRRVQKQWQCLPMVQTKFTEFDR